MFHEGFLDFRLNFIRIIALCFIAFIFSYYSALLLFAVIYYLFSISFEVKIFPIFFIIPPLFWLSLLFFYPQLYFGFYKAIIRNHKGEVPTFLDLFSGFRNFKEKIHMGLIFAVLLSLSLIPTVIIALPFGLLFDFDQFAHTYYLTVIVISFAFSPFYSAAMFMAPIMIEKQYKPREALRISFAYYKKHPALLSLLSFLLIFFHILIKPLTYQAGQGYYSPLLIPELILLIVISPIIHCIIVAYFFRNVRPALDIE